MTDIIDDANELAAMHLDHALIEQRRRARESEAQIVIGDDVICVDCHGHVESDRLKHLPSAVRCISCQRDKELRRAR